MKNKDLTCIGQAVDVRATIVCIAEKGLICVEIDGVNLWVKPHLVKLV